MTKYLPYLFPLLFYILVSWSGQIFTSHGLANWYPSLSKPSFTPPGYIIGIIWTVIYILCALSLILFIRSGQGSPYYFTVIGLYAVNGIVNAAWSYIFFTKHLLGFAVVDAALIGITVALIIAMAWPSSRIAAILLIPYLLWVSFATYLTYTIYRLNPL